MSLHTIQREVLPTPDLMWVSSIMGCPTTCGIGGIGSHHACAGEYLKSHNNYYCTCTRCNNSSSVVHYFTVSSTSVGTTCGRCREGNCPEVPREHLE